MRRIGKWLVPLIVIAAAIALALALREPGPAASDSTPPTPGPATAARDLAADEEKGGHTLARHVGRDDAALARRLNREPNLAAASTFLDRESAERAVAAAIAGGRARVDNWARRRGNRTLVLRWRGDGRVVGRVLERGAAEPVPAEGARVVLRRRGDGWFVLTAHPEVP